MALCPAFYIYRRTPSKAFLVTFASEHHVADGTGFGDGACDLYVSPIKAAAAARGAQQILILMSMDILYCCLLLRRIHINAFLAGATFHVLCNAFHITIQATLSSMSNLTSPHLTYRLMNLR